MKKILINSFLLFGFIFFGGNALAQNADDVILSGEEAERAINESEWGKPIAEVEGGRANCFDYYSFPSVQVSLGTDRDQYSSGEVINFSGEITNENSYPVVDGNVFARISRNNDSFVEEGYFIVDELVAIENIVIDKDSQIEGSFEWKIPEGMKSGDYIVDYFFSVGKKFNLGGLPFSNEIVIGKAFFTVEEEGNDAFVSFDRSGTQVNGEKYTHIGNWPVFEVGEKVTVSQPISNTFSESREVDVKYDLYYWDSLDEKDLISTKSDKITVLAGENSALEYEIPEMNEPIYYLKITATSGDQKSIVNVRLASEQERPRLNYPAVNKFPVYKGDSFTLFSCFHNTSSINTEGKVVVTLINKKGKEIGKVEYSGTIPSSMSADKTDIIAEDDYEYLKLKAKVYNKNDKIVDEYEVVYDCEVLNNCKKEDFVQKSDSDGIFSMKDILIIIFVIISIATVVVVAIEKKKK